MTSSYTVKFPEYFDRYAGEVEDKGYFNDLIVESGNLRFKPLFYDPVRLRQEVEDQLGSGAAAFAERNLVIIPTITRAAIEAAIAELAQADFVELAADTG